MPLGCQAKQLALIVDLDLDETLCTQINIAVEAGVEVLRRIDQLKIQVHYVTARTTISREATLMFLGEHRLPGRENVHYCPDRITSLEHKRRQHRVLSSRFNVIASIGDSCEEEEAARAAEIPFVLVDPWRPASAWAVLADRLAKIGGLAS